VKFSIVLFILILMSFSSVGLYQSWRMGSLSNEFKKIIQGCILVYFLLFTLIYLLRLSTFFPRRIVLSWAVAWPLVLFGQRTAVRSFLRYCRKRGRNIKRAVIAGETDIGHRLERWMNENPWSGTKILGYFDDSYSKTVKSNLCLGSLDELPEYVHNNTVDVVYIALPMKEENKIKELLVRLSNLTCSTYLIPNISFPFKKYYDITYLGGMPVFSIGNSRIHGINALLKRAEDIILGTVFLLLSSPVMLVIAVAIKLTDGSPIIFIHERIGFKGIPFKMYKFRTMIPNANEILNEMLHNNTQYKQEFIKNFKLKNDPRIIPRVGTILRKTNMDELPQFFNVLKGDMSIVGPRPIVHDEISKYGERYTDLISVKPGITGLWQVSGRNDLEYSERVLLDMEYIAKQSIWLDLKIILRTIKTIFTECGAY